MHGHTYNFVWQNQGTKAWRTFGIFLLIIINAAQPQMPQLTQYRANINSHALAFLW